MVGHPPQTLGTLAALILPALLINALFLLSTVPSAHASTCSSTGGVGGSPYYFARVIDKDYNSQIKGVGSQIQTSHWTFNTLSSASTQLWWVDLAFASGGWTQAGIGLGHLDGQTIPSRSIYFEESITGAGTPTMIYVSGRTIPDGDIETQEAWLYVGWNGHYWTTDKVSSSSQGTWSTNYDLGSSSASISYGTGQQSIEAGYIGTYTCNSYSQYNTSSWAKYTTNLGTEPMTGGTGWSSCTLPAPQAYYSMQLYSGTCNGTIRFWGD
jgi:hypothetical protein